jgi:hypothetical protein
MTTIALATALTWPSAVTPLVSAARYPEVARRPAGRASPSPLPRRPVNWSRDRRAADRMPLPCAKRASRHSWLAVSKASLRAL